MDTVWDKKEAQRQTNAAKKVLVGKTISDVAITGHDDGCVSINLLTLYFTDNTCATVEGQYGGYAADVCDEYVELITVSAVTK